MFKWLSRLLSAALTCAVLGLLLAPAEFLLEAPRSTVERRSARMIRRLVEKHDVVALFNFEDAAARDWIAGREAIVAGTVRVPGKFGSARKFDGRERTCIDWPLEWRVLGTNYTLAAWVRIDGRLRDQDILYSSGGGLRTGLHLEDGRLTFDVPGAERQSVSYVFERYGEFVHLAATVDSANGAVTLFENGRERARGSIAEVRWPIANIAAGKPMWYAVGRPFRGVLDDTALWTRTLSAQEIHALAKARKGLLETLSDPVLRARWRASQAWASVLSGCAKASDFFSCRAFRQPGRTGRASMSEIPEIRLVMSGRDRRHFIAAHRRSRLSGRRTHAAAQGRRVHAVLGGHATPARLRLHGSNTGYADFARPAYLLEWGGEGHFAGGRLRLLLEPPESGGLLLPFARNALRQSFGLPPDGSGLCRLRINGSVVGVYRYSDYRRNGLQPGDRPGIADGDARHHLDWRSIFRAVHREAGRLSEEVARWPVSAAELDELYGKVEAEYGGVLLDDLQSPLSRKELRLRFRRDRERLVAALDREEPEISRASKVAGFLDEFMVLGDNPSPFRLVEPLDVTRPSFPGVSLAWRSSAPSVLDAEGRIARPESGGPVEVTLTATVSDGEATVDKALQFRVMPRHISVPALFLSVRDDVVKARRVDAVMEVCEIGEDAPSAMLTATQGRRGGLNHRGNTSYWHNKKLFSIKTDTPHGVFGDGVRRMLKTVNSLQDEIFISNGLAYGLFRDFGNEASPRFAPFVRPAEIYVNGRYQGLFELCTRIDEVLLGDESAPGGDSPIVVYRHETLAPRDRLMRASRPPRRDGFFLGPYLALESLLEETDSLRRADVLERRVDVDSVVDLQILLNLMQNENGTPFHFLAHDVLVYTGGEDGTFFQVPWDFDRALGPLWSWISNEMMQELERGPTGYKQRLARRWFSLRSGLLDEASLLSRADSLAKPITGYVECDRDKWNFGGTAPYGSRVEDARAALRRNLKHMDRYLAAWRDGANAVDAVSEKESLE